MIEYEYKCVNCGRLVSEIKPIGKYDPNKKVNCPECGDEMIRVIAPGKFMFMKKGGVFGGKSGTEREWQFKPKVD